MRNEIRRECCYDVYKERGAISLIIKLASNNPLGGNEGKFIRAKPTYPPQTVCRGEDRNGKVI